MSLERFFFLCSFLDKNSGFLYEAYIAKPKMDMFQEGDI
ncbi:hypothetical protein B4119_0979 [Parageobacillus caldoxylosilyticus]|uniref:Uncharacterized protein n=1 Tax=Saccharococcus caldoxylosilyticus TaxID=81408 RepID=A0A150LM72_9BACL|nr:hypothetical protein B4119_0979 [Parageobacillus caldoxylosilyticus]